MGSNSSSGAGGSGGSGNSKSEMKKKAVADTQVSAYEREINKQKAAEKKQKESFNNYDKSNTNPNDNIQTKPKSTLQKIADKSPVYNLLTNNPISKKTEQVNRDFYDTKVKPYSGNTKGTYEDYIKSRGRGEVDAMGRTISQSDGGGNQVVQAPEVKAPKSIEVSQVTPLLPEVTAEEARATANELIRKRRRGRGRSLSMLQTSSEGLNNEGLTLSKKSLLG